MANDPVFPPLTVTDAENIIEDLERALNAHYSWIRRVQASLVCRTKPAPEDMAQDAHLQGRLRRLVPPRAQRASAPPSRIQGPRPQAPRIARGGAQSHPARRQGRPHRAAQLPGLPAPHRRVPRPDRDHPRRCPRDAALFRPADRHRHPFRHAAPPRPGTRAGRPYRRAQLHRHGRPRPFQENQRYLGPQCRRHRAARGRALPAEEHPAVRSGVPLRRRGIRDPAAQYRSRARPSGCSTVCAAG